MECVFCRIADNTEQAWRVCENDAFVAFLDKHPSAPGHTLVIPKAHVHTFAQLPPELLVQFQACVRDALRRVGRAVGTDEFTFGVNENEHLGRISHFHFHIIPRFAGDGGVPVQATVRNGGASTPESVFQKLTTT